MTSDRIPHSWPDSRQESSDFHPLLSVVSDGRRISRDPGPRRRAMGGIHYNTIEPTALNALSQTLFRIHAWFRMIIGCKSQEELSFRDPVQNNARWRNSSRAVINICKRVPIRLVISSNLALDGKSFNISSGTHFTINYKFLLHVISMLWKVQATSSCRLLWNGLVYTSARKFHFNQCQKQCCT